MSKILILLLSLLYLSSLLIPSSSFLDIGLHSFLTDEARRDPRAANDSFHALPAAFRKGLAASLPSPDHTTLVCYLLSFQISVPVYVKLVGPFSAAAPSLLHSFASAALSLPVSTPSAPVPTISPSGHALQLDSSHSALAPQISDAIRSHLDSGPRPALPLRPRLRAQLHCRSNHPG
ncbi:hypothetical protein COCNU_contig69274768G000010 [Cocos nucifera]|nr:hypothetical protein [Cocos nucifera]